MAGLALTKKPPLRVAFCCSPCRPYAQTCHQPRWAIFERPLSLVHGAPRIGFIEPRPIHVYLGHLPRSCRIGPFEKVPICASIGAALLLYRIQDFTWHYRRGGSNDHIDDRASLRFDTDFPYLAVINFKIASQFAPRLSNGANR